MHTLVTTARHPDAPLARMSVGAALVTWVLGLLIAVTLFVVPFQRPPPAPEAPTVHSLHEISGIPQQGRTRPIRPAEHWHGSPLVDLAPRDRPTATPPGRRPLYDLLAFGLVLALTVAPGLALRWVWTTRPRTVHLTAHSLTVGRERWLLEDPKAMREARHTLARFQLDRDVLPELERLQRGLVDAPLPPEAHRRALARLRS